MIKKIAWNTFKNTGDINTFLELKQIQDIEEQIGSGVQEIEQQTENRVQQMNRIGDSIQQQIQHQMEEQNGNNKNEWYNNIWK